MRVRNLIPLAVAALALTACGGTDTPAASAPVPESVSAADLAKVTLKVGDQKGGQKSYLEAAGLLKDLPYKIEWSTFTSGPPLLEAASAGAIDIGSVGNTPPLFAAAANAKIAVVSAQKGDVSSDTLLVPESSPLRSIEELRGKTIGVAKGSSAHGVVLSILNRAKLAPTDVTLSFLQPADAYAAFTQNKLDAWAVWDPYTTQALREAKARVLIDGTGTIGGGKPDTEAGPDALTNGYGFLVAGRASLTDAGKNAALRDYVIRYAKALNYAKTHADERATAWAKDTGLKPEIALEASRRGLDRPIRIDDKVIADEQQLADAFIEAKILPTKFKFADFVDNRFAADVAAVAESGAQK
ncbi:ABC transporter substrate-binding protein [Actinokineospora diospyrosa]|uniref:Sulfonate transport system substrate-binding protein n=1 Tax=Actinokineospora diospyrosa TaxID=103728 RepID=A0ABT1IKI3_9PSEU|nr:ABC transporter substrate-binding protein [Actinokineospora diospyrosa]MCP2273165.1 sulfonate transport system substrate-binding protein [Actinokineospora diospyrosa]